MAVTMPMGEAAALGAIAPAGRLLAPQATGLAPLAVYHDLRGLFGSGTSATRRSKRGTRRSPGRRRAHTEYVIRREVVPQLGVVLTGDRLVADADQTAGKRTVGDEAWHGSFLIADLAGAH
jgi:hypothetical protein